jgi:cyclopropane fatty-acyl-phospholipid synthase-like methyltransferase
MSETPEWRRDRVRQYYATVSGDEADLSWAGDTLAIHFGLDDGSGSSLQESFLKTNQYLADRAGIGPGTVVLDAGCGVGGSSIWLARERGARVTGITLVPHQVERARRHAAERGTGEGTVAFELGDFMTTRFPEGSFDVVWNLESFCYAHDARAYLEHVKWLLRDGGRFACLDVFAGNTGAEELQAISDGCAMGELHTPAALFQLLSRAGFVDIEMTDLSKQVSRSVAELHRMTQGTMTWLRASELLLGKDTRLEQLHTQGSLRCADAVLSGALVYAYVGARRPAR